MSRCASSALVRVRVGVRVRVRARARARARVRVSVAREILATYVHAYPNNVCSVWIYVASFDDMRAGATASVD